MLETKFDFMTWKHSTSQKFKVQPSTKKLMVIFVWNAESMLLVDFIPYGKIVKTIKYFETLK